jgi:hypothetical protein
MGAVVAIAVWLARKRTSTKTMPGGCVTGYTGGGPGGSTAHGDAAYGRRQGRLVP